MGAGKTLLTTPEKNVMRASSAYVKSPAQQASHYLAAQAQKQQTSEQVSAKKFLRDKEAQGIADIFQERIEQKLGEDLTQWEVADYQGDMIRKAIIKVRVSET